jgi:hypothetical protein
MGAFSWHRPSRGAVRVVGTKSKLRALILILHSVVLLVVAFQPPSAWLQRLAATAGMTQADGRDALWFQERVQWRQQQWKVTEEVHLGSEECSCQAIEACDNDRAHIAAMCGMVLPQADLGAVLRQRAICSCDTPQHCTDAATAARVCGPAQGASVDDGWQRAKPAPDDYSATASAAAGPVQEGAQGGALSSVQPDTSTIVEEDILPSAGPQAAQLHGWTAWTAAAVGLVSLLAVCVAGAGVCGSRLVALRRADSVIPLQRRTPLWTSRKVDATNSDVVARGCIG